MQGEFLVAILQKPVYTIYIVQHKRKKRKEEKDMKKKFVAVLCSCMALQAVPVFAESKVETEAETSIDYEAKYNELLKDYNDLLRLYNDLLEDNEEESSEAETETQTSFEGFRVLLAEDNDINAEIAMEILALQGALLDAASAKMGNAVFCKDIPLHIDYT